METEQNQIKTDQTSAGTNGMFGANGTIVEYVCTDCGTIYTGTKAPMECFCHCRDFELRGNAFIGV